MPIPVVFARAQDLLRAYHIDAYLILTHEDYRYFSGEDRFQLRAILPARGTPILITFRGEETEVRSQLSVEDVRAFGSVTQQMKDVVGVMQELAHGAEGPRVAVQFGFFTPAFLLTLFQNLNPHMQVVDVAPVMDALPRVKDAEEIAAIRQAGEIAAIGMRAAPGAVAPGVTEREVAAEAEYAMRKAGSDGTATLVFVNSGPRSGWLHGTATGKPLGAGDLVVIDLVPVSAGDCANLCRTVTVGPPSDAQRTLFELFEAARAAAHQVMRPGVPLRAMDDAPKAVYAPRGMDSTMCWGSATASASRSKRRRRQRSSRPMPEARRGMVLTIEHAVLSVPGVGGVRGEDTYRILSGGPVPLTEFPVGLEAAR